MRKHGLAQWPSGMGWHGLRKQVVPGLYPRHARLAWHGPISTGKHGGGPMKAPYVLALILTSIPPLNAALSRTWLPSLPAPNSQVVRLATVTARFPTPNSQVVRLQAKRRVGLALLLHALVTLLSLMASPSMGRVAACALLLLFTSLLTQAEEPSLPPPRRGNTCLLPRHQRH